MAKQQPEAMRLSSPVGREMTAGWRTALIALGLPVVLSLAPVAFAAEPAPVPTATPKLDATVDQPRASALAARITAILQAAGPNARQSYLMGRIQAEVGAAGVNCSTAKAALAQVPVAGLTKAAAAALASVAASADLCSNTGTGAVNRQQALSQPNTLGLPGGSSNYQ